MVNLEHIEDRLIEMYEQLNIWAINDIVERIMKNEVLTETAKYRIYRLQSLGVHLTDLKKIIKKLSRKSEKEVEDIFKRAGVEDIKFSNKIIIQSNPLYISDRMINILNYYSGRTNNEFIGLTDRFVSSSINTLAIEMDKVHFRVVTGIQSQSEAIRETINELGNKGITVKSINGRNESVESSVRRIIHTGVNKCVGSINLQRAKENGYNHVLVSSHLGARHVENANPLYLSHDIWQGKVYNLNN